ncbi:MAG: diguanylate cyclase [Candidatus Gastranaerophilales bacterium]|nr:diguanylate cyclase [Candidatus Gastranaerophilales bacterium]
MNQNQKTSDKNNMKSEHNIHSNPIMPRKTANRLYGGYNNSPQPYGYQRNIDPVDVISDFCSSARSGKTSEDILSCVHNTAISKLGYSFTAIGLVNKKANYIQLKFTDYIGNIYSSKIILSEYKNPIIECYINKTKKNIDNFGFLNVPYFQNSPGIIFPLMNQGECMGIFIAGSSSLNQQNTDLINILTDYLSLFIINKNLSEKLIKNPDVDTLTGLKNHKDFHENLSLEMKNAEYNGQPVSVIIFDIINISKINREFGHSKGDEIIRMIANKVKQNIRDIDIAARYGGDEIAVILPGVDNAKAIYMAEYINHNISCCLIDDIGEIKLSIGVSTYPTCSKQKEKVLILAEQAMLISRNKEYHNGISSIVSAQDIDFWNEMALDSLAAVIAKKHSQWGINFEDELVNQFHNESMNCTSHIIDVVTSLAGAIDAKDTYTRGHSQEVCRYTEALARTINLPPSEVERIKLGALLHDVGKIGISESILRKQTALNDQEWEIMKQHPRIGVEKVIKPISSIRDLIPIIIHHHERWDGTGYPDKLAGVNIPLGARIVAIADAFHALISDRPYRKGLNLYQAIEVLRAGAGIQWDKELIRKFIIIAPSLVSKV